MKTIFGNFAPDLTYPINHGGLAYMAQQQAEMRDLFFPKSGKSRSGFSANAQNLWRVTQGSNSAVIKKIHNGGTHTAKQLGNQLDYIFSKSATIFGNMVEHDHGARTLTPDQRKAIVEQWSDEWTGDPKNGHTTHLIISFPHDVGPKRVPPIVEQWCAEAFQSGGYVEGEEWAYVAALHTDRVNAHVHVVINNRGIENDTWFYMAKGHAFDLQKMKDRLVEIAADHGMFLDSSTRLDRGVLTYGPSRAEIERAGREGRVPVERFREGRALNDALEKIQGNITTLRNLAVVATLISDDELAQKFEAAADTLESGGIIHPRNTEIVMDAQTIKTRGDLATAFDTWLDETEKDISKLPAQEQREVRGEFHQIASEIMNDLGDQRGAQLMHHQPRTAIYQTEISDTRIASMGVVKEVEGERVTDIVEQITRLAADAGLDTKEVGERLNTGAASAWQEREWVKKDILDVAEAKNIDVSTEEGRGRVAHIVDGFYAAAATVIAKAVEVDHGAENDRVTRTLTAMSNSLETHGKVEFETDDHAARFTSDFRERYGEDVVEKIAEGDTSGLAADFPDEKNRRAIARAVVAAARTHQQVGMTLAQVKEANEKLAEQDRDVHEFSRSKDFGHEL